MAAHNVVIEDLDAAAANEDDFDACLTAAALMRCVMERVSLCPTIMNAPHAEGGILGTGAINLGLSEQTFRVGGAPTRSL
jgi:hypothetical protein